MSILDGLRAYYERLGPRGLLAITSHRLTGWPKEISVCPPGARNPVQLRVRTSDPSTYSDVWLQGEYDYELPFTPEVIVDAGANIGMASIFFANRFPAAKIFAIEAEASNFELLTRNVRPYPTITPIHTALWNRDGQISVSEPDPSTGAAGKWGCVTHEGAGVKVAAITMRTLMRQLQIGSIDVLKVDIEGAEKEVFEACDWVQDIRCLMIELHDRFKPGCSEAVDSAMRGFSKREKGETTFYLRQAA